MEQRDRWNRPQATMPPLQLGNLAPQRAKHEDESEILSVEHLTEVPCWPTSDFQLEILMAEYLKKKMSKELAHSNNPPKLQQMIDEGKRSEWQNTVGKGDNVRIHYGKKAEALRREFPHRFIGSRFVLTRKPLEEGQSVDPDNWSTFTVKGRWCLQGHLDPDLEIKAREGQLKSPTLSQLGRTLLMQVIASQGWTLQLGDVKGAFRRTFSSVVRIATTRGNPRPQS